MTDNKNGIKADPHYDRFEEALELSSISNDNSPRGLLYRQGLEAFDQLGIVFETSPGALYAHHKVFFKEKPPQIGGVNFPSSFEVKLAPTETSQLEELENILTAIADSETRKFWTPAIKGSNSKEQDIHNHTLRILNMKADQYRISSGKPFDLGIDAYGGNPGGRTWLPPKDWFNPALYDVTFADVATIFPQAEKELLKLAIGRVCVGRNGSQPVGDYPIIKHTYRMACLIVGEPGLGKSELLDRGFFKALQRVGYTVGTFSDLSARFNLAGVIQNDIIYKDDIANKSMKRLVGSENLKIIVTGGNLRCEDKGVDATNVPSHGVVFINANDFDPRLSYEIDSGVANRVKLLKTYSASQLKQVTPTGVSKGSPDLRPEFHIPWLANKLNVSPEAIYLWVSRLACDNFLKIINSPASTDNQLKIAVDKHSAKLRLTFYKDATSQIMFSCLGCYYLANPKISTDSIPSLEAFPWDKALTSLQAVASDSNLDCLRSTLKYLWESTGNSPLHVYTGVSKIMPVTITEAIQKRSYAAEAGSGIATELKNLFGSLRLNDGFPLSSDLPWLSKEWETVKANYQPLINQVNSVRTKCSEQVELLGKSVLKPS